MTTGWHPADIEAALKKANTNLTALARETGLNDGACRRALVARHVEGEKAIATRINAPLWELWPDRWAPPATPGGEAIRIDGRRKPAPDAA